MFKEDTILHYIYINVCSAFVKFGIKTDYNDVQHTREIYNFSCLFSSIQEAVNTILRTDKKKSNPNTFREYINPNIPIDSII